MDDLAMFQLPGGGVVVVDAQRLLSKHNSTALKVSADGDLFVLAFDEDGNYGWLAIEEITYEPPKLVRN